MRCAPRPARTKAKLAASLLVLMALSHSSAQGQTYIDLPEQEIISGNRLEDKSTAYYQLLISDTFFTGKENLAIRVIAESFGSDPDIFISKVSVTRSMALGPDQGCSSLFFEINVKFDRNVDEPEALELHGQRLVLREEGLGYLRHPEE